MTINEIDAGNYYWVKQRYLSATSWKICYVSEDSDHNLWINYFDDYRVEVKNVIHPDMHTFILINPPND